MTTNRSVSIFVFSLLNSFFIVDQKISFFLSCILSVCSVAVVQEVTFKGSLLDGYPGGKGDIRVRLDGVALKRDGVPYKDFEASFLTPGEAAKINFDNSDGFLLPTNKVSDKLKYTLA